MSRWLLQVYYRSPLRAGSNPKTPRILFAPPPPPRNYNTIEVYTTVYCTSPPQTHKIHSNVQPCIRTTNLKELSIFKSRWQCTFLMFTRCILLCINSLSHMHTHTHTHAHSLMQNAKLLGKRLQEATKTLQQAGRHFNEVNMEFRTMDKDINTIRPELMRLQWEKEQYNT